MQPSTKTIITVHKPTLIPKFTNIGFGNPRYNSMVVCNDDSVLIPCGTSLRRVNLTTNQILFNKQIGCSQIFQILQNNKWVMVVSFQGLITFLNKDKLQIEKEFYIAGKQIRHSSISDQYIAVSCQLNNGIKQANLLVYSIADILAIEGVNIKVQPKFSKIGFYYFPQIIQNSLYFIQHDDPNPKGRSRTQTVLNVKLPIKHKIFHKNLTSQKQIQQIYHIKFEGEILCAAHNAKTKQIFYLHQSKKITVLNLQNLQCQQISIVASNSPYCIQPFKDGIIFTSQSSQLTYLEYKQKPVFEQIKLKAKGLTTNYSIKQTKTNNFIFFNENGLQYYDCKNDKTYSQLFFDITNCGISFNLDASKFAVADFGGNIYVFGTNQNNVFPVPISKVLVGMPVRSLVWCHDTNNIVIGCVGGFLFRWDGVSQQAKLITQTNDHTVNIVRYYKNFVILGTSDGYVHIFDSKTMEQLYKFQAHTPIHYESQKDRQLFGSMKNYAQIWSIIAYPTSDQRIFNLVTCSEDQTQKVFKIQILQSGQINHKQDHHLIGHSLAVTSIDWKHMGKGLGPIYVSCSDDKIVRFRNPQNMFEILHELQTSTIKEWHTLTYLSLQPNGHRVAIGSQNGYLFIFDILTKQLLFGQKIHLGGVEGMDWLNGKLITCSSDLCISIAYV